MGEVAQTITALGALVAAIGVVLAAYWSYRAKTATSDNKREITVIGGQIREVGKRIDGRMDELLRAAAATSRAEGVAAGEQAQRDRAAPSDNS